MMKIAISGASGRMGKMLIEAVVKADDMTLAAALCPTGDAMIGQDAGAFMGAATGVLVTDDIEALKGCDVLIDFTRPAGTLAYLAFCREHGIGVVIGTTGFDAQGKAAIEAAASDIPIVFAPNMSVGVNAAFKLIEVAAKLLADYDCEIVEMHHKHKVDAPSGTALEMGRRVAAARGAKFEDVAVLSREGHTGERRPGSIGFAALRGGDVVGDHTVIFAADGERLELTHKAADRKVFAGGALRAAAWVIGKEPGLYGMEDVLNLK